ncbi:MAG: anti-sigma factor family protein [Anaerolineales bacterium]
MNTPSFHDVEQLSAYLDGQLSQAKKTRLESRLQSDPVLAATLAELRQARTILQRTPGRRTPRNFTLTPKMAGIKPPVPRLVPALGWASAVAMVLFVFTLGTNLIGQISLGANAPMLSAAPMASEGYGLGGGPSVTQTPATDNSQVLPTPEPYSLTVPGPTPPGESRVAQPPAAASTTKSSQPVDIWIFIWFGLAVILIMAGLFIRLSNDQAFRRKVGSKRNK